MPANQKQSENISIGQIIHVCIAQICNYPAVLVWTSPFLQQEGAIFTVYFPSCSPFFELLQAFVLPSVLTTPALSLIFCLAFGIISSKDAPCPEANSFILVEAKLFILNTSEYDHPVGAIQQDFFRCQGANIPIMIELLHDIKLEKLIDYYFILKVKATPNRLLL